MNLLETIRDGVRDGLEKNRQYEASADKEALVDQVINTLNNVQLIELIEAALDRELSK